VSTEYSGERTPSEDPAFQPVRALQLAAYHRALEYANGRRVLEIGCGEAVGTSILAAEAESVVALDYSRETLQAACQKHGDTTIEFVVMKVPPIDFADNSFDVIVCFQMIEHLEEPDGLVAEIKRVLHDRGVALFSTVNKEETLTENPYHVHEFGPHEFNDFLKSHFGHVQTYGVFGDELFMKYRQTNQRWVRALMRADIFNLVDRIPRALRRRLYDAAGRFMRIRLKRQNPALCESITHENFLFRPNEFDGCLDLFGVCRTRDV
jgi:ubiquinone/menaquinone biosynthesis C-methylase UbiE